MPSTFCILAQRNLQILLRRWKYFILEVLATSIMFAIIVSNPTAERIYKSIDFSNLKWKLTKKIDIGDTSMINKEIKYISYIPGNQPSTELVQKAAQRLQLQVIEVPNEKVMETQFDQKTVLCGVVFDNQENYPKELSVRLRFPNQLRSVKNIKKSENNFWEYRLTGEISDEEAVNKNLYSGIYMREGFLQLQNAIFQEWLNKLKQNAEHPNLNVAWFVFPRDHRKRHVLNYSGLVSLLYHFAFCFSFCNTVYFYARTCQKNMFPHLWRYGYCYSTIWYANILITVLKLLLLDLISICVLYPTHTGDSAVISFSEVKFGHFMLFLILYNLQYLVCAIFYALLMQNGKKSVLLALVIWFATYGCFTSILRGNSQINNFVIIILLIAHFNNVFPLGMTYLYNHLEENPKVYWILIECMLANIFLYLFLVSWIQYLKPGRYMQLYKYDLLYWRSIFCKNKKPFYRKDKNLLNLRTPSMNIFEYGPLGAEGSVKLLNIFTSYKLFPDRNHLKNISMTLFKGEITVLWGHHSSGKTSLICLLAGWRIPDSGSIKFDDLDLHENWNNARKICDVSMPNNSLYDYLTVRSTLKHFVQIKQELKNKTHLHAEVHKWLEVLKPVIQNHNLKVSDLNFDQKRLLCLCIALSCDTKIILLDEPTQRMRLQEKHIYWNILRAEKTNRVIFLTTCSLDEANYIGDRIALLDNGKILAYGTIFFLKTLLSDFYYLIVYKYEEAPTIPITKNIRTFISDITVEHETSTRIVYKVHSERRPLFQRMLIRIENLSQELGIRRIQVQSSTLNDAVIELTKDKVEPLDEPSKVFFENRKKNEKSFKKQIHAMIFKKTVNQMPYLCPAAMMLIAIIITLIVGKLSHSLPTPLPRHSASKFGLNNTATERRGIPLWNTDDCKFIRIKNTKTDKHVKLFNWDKYFFHKNAYKCHKNESFENYLMAVKPSPKNHLGALEFSTKNDWTIWLNKREFQSAPVTLNLAQNLILESNFRSNAKYIIKIANDPFLINVLAKATFMKTSLSHLSVSRIVGIVIPFMASCFIIALIEERHSHMWVIQRLAGLHLGIYWIVTLIWDWLTFILCAFMFIIVQLIINIEGIGYVDKFWIFFVIILYGVSALGWTYITSMFTKKSKIEGFCKSLLISLLTGIVAYHCIWDVFVASKIQMAFWYIFMMSPHFAVLEAMSSIYMSAKFKSYCEEMCNLYEGCVKSDKKKICLYIADCCDLPVQKNQFQYSINCLLIIAGLSFFAMFIITIFRTQRNILTKKNITKYQTVCFAYDDAQVKAIREEIAYASAQEMYHKTYVVDQLELQLPKKPGLMYSISFEAKKGQCIAIYGNQRSGISRLARLLSGIDVFRFGSIFVEGVDMKSEILRSWNYVGYCPPNKGLYNNFTPRELMLFLAMIAGISSKETEDLVQATFQLLNMGDYVNIKCGQLSVEKQRKVNIAAAIIIFKSVLIIDQPTNGIPFWASQEIWNALNYLLQLGRTIIFTTSAVIECRVLAEKMLIYERGEMLAYDEYYPLLGCYAKGIFLQVTLNRDGESIQEIQNNFRKDIENLYRFISYLNSNSELCARTDNYLTFYLPIEHLKYSALFGSIEKNKIRLNISNYTINQCTIEDLIYLILSLRPHRLHLRHI